MTDHPVIAATGGSDSAGAVQLGTVMARALRQSLVIASAYHYRPMAFTAQALGHAENQTAFDAAQARVQQAARGHAEQAARAVPGDVEVIERVLPATGVAEALMDLAREVDATLVVTGRDLDGHVTRDVLGHASCPVLVSPLTTVRPADERPRIIGVAYDGSPAGELAVTAALHLAMRVGARVRILTVDAHGAPQGTAAEGAAASISETVDAEAVHLRGLPADRLVEASEALDLLLCGSHARGRLAARLLGSVSSRLVEHALCPVLVVPPRMRHRATLPLGITTAAAI